MANDATLAACFMAGVLEALHEERDISDTVLSDVNQLLEEADLEHVKVGGIHPSTNGVEHLFDEGDYALDQHEPTSSREKNTVRVIELTNQQANEYETDDQCLVSEYKTNSPYPEDDAVVIGKYPHMSGNREYAFPESRLRPV